MLMTLLVFGPAALTRAAEPAPLVLEARIPLGQVSGRIDHLTVDLQRQRVFVAELGNDSVGVIDLRSGRLLRSIPGLSEPQGIVYVPTTDELYVANGGNGSIQVFRGPDLLPAATINLGDDADNLRLDSSRGQVIAGFGNGALALIDVVSHRVVTSVPLPGHPEGFQLSKDAQHVYVNVPGKAQIATVDLATHQRGAPWPTGDLRSNYPMMLDQAADGLWVAFRSPPRLVRFDTQAGKSTASLETCNDSDDVFIDARRHRLYVICGGGQVETWEDQDARYERIASTATSPGARTGLFVPELDRLYIAAPARVGKPASILVFDPVTLSQSSLRKTTGD